jgi:phycocyanobilin lyase beta subunit
MVDFPAPDSANNPVSACIQAVRSADSAAKLVQAVRQLSLCEAPEAIPTLMEVLGFNNPGAAVAAVDGLVRLGDVAAEALFQQLDDYNYTARAWALRALALLGDPRALDLLRETAQGDFSLSVRRAAARGLGGIKWEKIPENDRLDAQTKALETLILAAQDPEWVVRYGAVAGTAALGEKATHPTILNAVQTALEGVIATEQDGVVKARAQWAIESLR